MPTLSNDGRSYSLSPSISGASMSGAGSPPASIGADLMGLSLTSSMLPPSMVAYADPSALSGQPYSMVHPSNIRHSSRSSPELSGYGRSSMGSSFQSLNIPGPVPTLGSQALGPRRPNSQNSSVYASAPSVNHTNPLPDQWLWSPTIAIKPDLRFWTSSGP